MNKKKQQLVKRKYVKKRKETVDSIGLLPPPTPIQPKKDNELKELLQIISIFDNWDAEQRSRNLKYIASRYYDFL